jgi:hypothetical protein
MPFWSEDERQVYLIGLRSFARGEWPYFGADVVWNGSQLPGALQALLVRWALAIWPAPEAPIVLLNLISVASLAGLAWYFADSTTCPVADRGPGVSLPVDAELLRASSIPPSCPARSRSSSDSSKACQRFVAGGPGAAWASMGFGLVWMTQIHMSWVVLPAYACGCDWVGRCPENDSGSVFSCSAARFQACSADADATRFRRNRTHGRDRLALAEPSS